MGNRQKAIKILISKGEKGDACYKCRRFVDYAVHCEEFNNVAVDATNYLGSVGDIGESLKPFGIQAEINGIEQVI